MDVNPLEHLSRVAENHQLDFTTELQIQQRSRHRHIGPEPRKWVQSKFGSRIKSSSPSCWSTVQSRTLKNQHSPQNAARERNRVRSLRDAFHSLQAALPSVPPDTKLSKLDVLVLATNYIAHLTETLDQGGIMAETALTSRSGGYLHPVKKWPMRSLLYCGNIGELLSGVPANQTPPSGPDRGSHPLTPDTKC